jgi:predicted nucleotidyltransferase
MIADVEQKQGAVADLCRQFHVNRLYVFGSARTERFDPARSDIDFVVAFQPLPMGQYANAYFGLLYALEAVFGRKVDLVTETSIRNPYFREEIEETKELLYAA